MDLTGYDGSLGYFVMDTLDLEMVVNEETSYDFGD